MPIFVALAEVPPTAAPAAAINKPIATPFMQNTRIAGIGRSDSVHRHKYYLTLVEEGQSRLDRSLSVRDLTDRSRSCDDASANQSSNRRG